MEKKFWIVNSIHKPGSLRKSLGIKKGETISPEKLNAAIDKGGLKGQRANLAKTLRGFHK